jgi:bifunctional UDP-N-acetylglucosamine pyrophosphorylase/glucosamine-1-phosphate N-acetyltransferase
MKNMMLKDLVVVLLAGGKSERFWPLPHKMHMRFLGRTFLETQIENLKAIGFKSIVVVVNEDSVDELLPLGVQKIIQRGDGQGAAILSAKTEIAAKPVLILNADDVIEPELLKDMIKNIDGRNHLLVGYKVHNYFPGGYLVLNGKKIAKIVEKPGEGNEPSSYVRLVCDYFPNATTLLEYLEKVAQTETDNHYEETLSLMMEDSFDFEMVEYQSTWVPLKYPWQTLDVSNYFLQTIKKSKIAASAQIHKTVSITGPVIIEKNVRVLEFAKLVGPLYIGEGAIIGNHTLIRSSMIGKESVIGFNSDVTRSYLGQNVWLHSNYVGDSILSDGVTMGAGTILANLRLDEGDIATVVKSKRVSTMRNKLGGILGVGARVGVGSYIMPGVKIGAGSVIGAGVILQEDIAENQRCFIKQNLTIDKLPKKIESNRNTFRHKI